MPVIIALAVRSLIQMTVTLGIITLAEKYILPLINKAIVAIVQVFGVSEEDAKDFMANEIIAFAEQIGIGMLVLQTKIPTKIAERLGFTSKGWRKRPLKGKTATIKTPLEKIAERGRIDSPEMATEIAKQAAQNRLIKLGVVSLTISAITAMISVPTQFMYMLAQYIDYGNWPSGTFHDFFAKIFKWLGLPANQRMESSKILSNDVWSKIFNTYKLAGAVGINDPYKNQTTFFSLENLKTLVDKVASNILLEGGTANIKNVLGATQGFIILNSPMTNAKIDNIIGATPPTVAIPQIKVFTGVLTQGKLGETEPFIAREDDLIDSMDDLQTAAQNNLANFIVALPGKIVYEIKIVSTITTKDGFIQRGAAQQIQTGTTKDGSPKFKTVINKFAIIDIFVFTQRNIRTKIQTVVLGPVDSVAFQPKAAELQIAERTIKSELITSDINEINTITTENPIIIAAPPQAAPPAP